MKKLILFLTAISFYYIAVSQCVVYVSNDSTLQCGSQMNLKIQFPWRTIPSNLTSHLNDIHFTSPSDGYIVGANGEIQKTSDKGETFTLLTSNTTETLNSVWFLNSNTGFCVGNNGLILKTNNGGSSWVAAQGPVSSSYMTGICFVDSLTGYISGTGTNSVVVFKTTDAGSNWSAHTINGVYVGYRITSKWFVKTSAGTGSDCLDPLRWII